LVITVDLDANGQAYYDGMMNAVENSDDPRITGQEDDLVVAAENFQKAMMSDFHQKAMENSPIMEHYRRHKGFVLQAVREVPGRSTGQVYEEYCSIARICDEAPMTSRRVTQLLAELEMEGLVEGTMANRGRFGRTKYWNMVI
jgi:Cdc6-like AAA superfamily ATPase